MTIVIDPSRQKMFQAIRAYLSILKNNGNSSSKPLTHNETMDYLFSNVPIIKEVEEYMQQTEKVTKKIHEQREELMIKAGVQA